MDRLAGYLLHKYLKDPYYWIQYLLRRRKRDSPLKLRSQGVN